MIERKTTGKIQLILGIILLVAGIIGLIYMCSMYNQLMGERMDSIQYSVGQGIRYIQNFSSNETKYIAAMNIASISQETWYFLIEILVIGFGFSILLIILSLILILEGLANISK